MSSYARSFAGYLCLIFVLCGIGILVRNAPVVGQTLAVPGGFIVKSYAPITRPRLTASQIQSFVPLTRGKFTFPAPYNTEGIRLTVPSDCGGTDCLHYVSYSYWRNMNNHVGSDTMYIYLGLSQANGGPTLFSYNKVTDVVTKVGPLFDVGSPFRAETGEGWYFSATNPTMLYITRWGNNQFVRYDVVARTFQTVFDVDNCLLCGLPGTRAVWQVHSSDDDKIHAFTVMDKLTSAYLGCAIYNEPTKQFTYLPRIATSYDECNLDKSGHYLMMLDGQADLDNYIHDLQSGTLWIILDQNGRLGHLDMGDSYAAGANGYDPHPNATLLIKFPVVSPTGPFPVVHYNPDWNTAVVQHISHQNRKSGVPPEQQYACGSNADNITTRENEIVCFRLDTSLDELVVAPVMTNLNAAGGGDDYGKAPKGNLDVTGQYFIWTSYVGGNRLDAFLVKVPSHLLVGGQTDLIPPAPPTNLRAM